MSHNYMVSEISSVLVCRGCLATDVRLHDMRENRLMEAYWTLIGAAQISDDLPHYICSYCAALLLKCTTFRTKCIDTMSFFRNSLLNNVDLNLQIKQLNIQPYFRQSYTQTIDLDGSSNNPESVNTDIKIEADNKNNIFNGNVNSNLDISGNIVVETAINKQTDDLDVYINQSDDSDHVSDRDSDAKSETSIKIEFDIQPDVNSKLKIKHEKSNANKRRLQDINIKRDIKKKKVGLDKDVSNTSINNDIKKNKSKVKSKEPRLKTKEPKSKTKEPKSKTKEPKSKTKEPKSKTKEPKLKTEVSKVRKEKAIDTEESETENFCKTYNVDEVVMSKEEQLKEIEDRKNSTNYKRANFKCDICFKGFVIEESYKNHMLLHDNISGTFVCDICNIHNSDANRLMKHKYSHGNKYICKDCGYVSRNKCQVKTHYKWHGGSRYKCKHCKKEFDRRSTYCGHMKNSHPTSASMVRCEICGASVIGLRGLRFHEIKAHIEMNSPECLCSGCGTQFYCSDAFKAHQGADGACSSRTKYCVRCGGAFHTQLQLEEHEAEQRKPPEEYKCLECKKTFKNYQSYDSHMKYTVKHTSAPQGSINARKQLYLGNVRNNYPKEFICDLCGKLFVNIHILQAHQLSHSNYRPFKCTECPKSFKAKLNLRVHMDVHRGVRPHRCAVCSKAFQTKRNLWRHMLVHTGERPYSCDVCGKTFQAKSYVQLHIKTVHMKIPMPPRIRHRKIDNK